MKKIIFIIAIILSVASSFAEGGKIIYIREYTKRDGGKNFLGQDRFRDVDKKVTLEYRQNIDCTIHTTQLTCLKPGHSKCTYKLASSIVPINDDNTVRAEIFDAWIDEAMEYVDNQLISEGNFSGKTSKTIVTKSLEGNTIRVHVDASWSDGDANGNGKIILKIIDISDYLN